MTGLPDDAEAAVRLLTAAHVRPTVLYRCPRGCRVLRVWVSPDDRVLVDSSPRRRRNRDTERLDMAWQQTAGAPEGPMHPDGPYGVMVLSHWIDPATADNVLLYGIPHGYCPHHGDGAPLPPYHLLLSHAAEVAAIGGHQEVLLDGRRFKQWPNDEDAARLPRPATGHADTA